MNKVAGVGTRVGSTLDRLCKILEDHSGVPRDRIQRNTELGSFTHRTPGLALELDSLDKVQVAMAIEEEFFIDLPDADVDRPELATVGGLAQFIDARVDEQDRFSLDKVEAHLRRELGPAEPSSRIMDWGFMFVGAVLCALALFLLGAFR